MAAHNARTMALATALGVTLLVPQVPVGGASEPPGIQALTVAQLERVNAENQKRIATAIVEENVTDRRHASAPQEELMRSRIVNGICRHTERLIASAVGEGLPEGTVARLRARQDERLAWVERSVLVDRLNTVVSLHRVSTIDFGARRARHEDKDLRDLDALAREYGLTALEQFSLDRSVTLLLREDTAATWFKPNKVAVVCPAPRFDANAELRKFGVLPGSLSSWPCQWDMRVSGDPGDAMVQLVAYQNDRLSLIVTLEEDVGYRMTRLLAFGPDGSVSEEFNAWDFRKVQEVYVPFRTSTRLARDGVPDYWIEERTVKRVSINPALPDPEALFCVPQAYRVEDLTKAPRLEQDRP